ncbi:MAG: penicillin-binding protein 2 [Acidobacteria bacterium]|nr:penicillin-binding protein 2 [Acidobacteriota bacterium]
MPDSPRLRLLIVGVVGLSLFAALLARLWYLQVLTAPQFKLQAKQNQVRVVKVAAPRGRILDRNGVVLVDNRASNVVAVDRSRLTADERAPLLERLSRVLHIPDVELSRRLDDVTVSPYTPVPLAEDVPEPTMVTLRERQEDFPGVVARTVAVREYPHGSLAAHVLGYVGEVNDTDMADNQGEYQLGDQIGKAGVERTYEKELRGAAGEERIEVDAKGTPIRTLSRRGPVQGSDLVLSLDINVQARAEASLSQGLAAARGRPFEKDKGLLVADAGAVVVLDAKEGSVVAMASYPTFDLPGLANGVSKAEAAKLFSPSSGAPFINRAIQGQYAPGSTWKLVTADAAMRTGLVSPNYTYNDTGSFEIKECVGTSCIRHNAGSRAFGRVDFRRALTVSSDVYFYNLGSMFWQRRKSGHFGETPIQESAAALGFGRKTGVPLQGESEGRVPTPETRAELHRTKPKLYPTGGWFEGDNVNLAIGQGELGVTPIQLANAYATYANGGTRFSPNIALRVQRQDGTVVRDIAPRVLPDSLALSPQVRQPIMAGLAGVVSDPDGTAFNAFASFPLRSYGIAGKTGTAQAKPKQDTALFVGYGPTSDPRYAVAVVMEQSGFGASAAAPVARRVFSAIAGVDGGNGPATFVQLNGAGD